MVLSNGYPVFNSGNIGNISKQKKPAKHTNNIVTNYFARTNIKSLDEVMSDETESEYMVGSRGCEKIRPVPTIKQPSKLITNYFTKTGPDDVKCQPNRRKRTWIEDKLKGRMKNLTPRKENLTEESPSKKMKIGMSKSNQDPPSKGVINL